MNFSYLDDGANYQAQAVLAFLRGTGNIEESWNAEFKYYDAKPEVARWHNCREQGYVVSLRGPRYSNQINIAWFEHRNSDSICAVEWNATYTNPPTINDIPEDAPFYKSKWDVSHSVSVGKASEMADWINERLHSFWLLEKSKEGK